MNTKQWHLEEVAGLYKKAIAIIVERSKKYTTEENPFSTFEKAAEFARVSPQEGILVRLGDKFARLDNALRYGFSDDEFSDESFDDTIIDICNYLVILRNYRLHQRRLNASENLLLDDASNDGLFQVAPAEPPPNILKRLASTLGVTVE